MVHHFDRESRPGDATNRAQVRNNHSVALASKRGATTTLSVHVTRPAVQKNHRWTIRWTGFSVTNIQSSDFNCFSQPNASPIDHDELGCGNSRCCSAWNLRR